jgi:hypothetical protein
VILSVTSTLNALKLSSIRVRDEGASLLALTLQYSSTMAKLELEDISIAIGANALASTLLFYLTLSEVSLLEYLLRNVFIHLA